MKGVCGAGEQVHEEGWGRSEMVTRDTKHSTAISARQSINQSATCTSELCTRFSMTAFVSAVSIVVRYVCVKPPVQTV